ncbi:MAG: hypothetical protein L0Y55_13505, partial [Anaerolineales bacterium]|nr:hypothetical protein [Anaerolineales bacterium]
GARMITPAERAYIAGRAYIPEHLPHYVTAISQTEPFLIGDFVAHVRGAHLIFVGYPLSENFDAVQMLAALEQAQARFKPTMTAIIAPALPAALENCAPSPPDEYYRLDLAHLVVPQKTRNMLTHARRDISVSVGKLGKEHVRLIEEFLRAHHLDDATRFIFQRAPEYAKRETARVFDARDARGDLVAFDIADFGARQYAFYMFNFRSRKHVIPGASDLLLARLIERTQAEGKRYLNLGLGIDAGIAFFKRKWGATPFLKHCACVQRAPHADAWQGLFDKL